MNKIKKSVRFTPKELAFINSADGEDFTGKLRTLILKLINNEKGLDA